MNLRILLVEDNPDDAELLLRRLREASIEPDWERVDAADALREALARERWDVALVDFNLPGFSGPEALGLLAELAPDTPAITVSGAISEEIAVATITAGAVDYVLKDNLTRLAPAVLRAVEGAELRRKERQAAAQAAESDALYRRIVETAGEGIWAMDGEDRTTFINPQMAASLGYEVEEMLGRPVPGFMFEEDLADFDARMRERRRGESGKYERRFRRKDGGEVWTAASWTVELGPEGEYLGSFGMFTDITERKQAEHRAEERAKELRALYALAEMAQREGFTLDRLYQGLTDILPESWQYPEMTCARTVIGEREFRTNNFMESAWMQSAPVTVSGSAIGRIDVGYREERPEEDEGPFLKEERRLIDALAERLGQIIEHKWAEEALRESEERYRGYVDNAPYGVFVSDQQGRYLDVNLAAAELTGYAPEELVQLSIPDVLAPGSRDWGQQHFARLLSTGRSSGEGVFLRKDGTSFPARVDAVRLSATRFLGFIVDVTEQQRAAAELEASAAQVKQALTATVAALSATTELRDPYTAGHQRRVAELAGAIAAGLGWDEARIEMVETAGLLHDVGKIIVPAEILAKPGRLSEMEMEIIRGHAAASAALIAGIEFGGPVAAAVNQHHERLDGSGYPQGLTGENILPEARVLAVADVVEAMSSHRPHRPSLGMEAALAEIKEHAGVKYDDEVVAVCVDLVEEQGFRFTP